MREEGGGRSQWAADRQDDNADSEQCRAADRGRCTAAACRFCGMLAQTGPLFRERRCEERSAIALGSQCGKSAKCCFECMNWRSAFNIVDWLMQMQQYTASGRVARLLQLTSARLSYRAEAMCQMDHVWSNG